MKLAILFVSLVLLPTLAQADGDRPHFTPAQHQAMKACLAESGVALPAHPKFSAGQKAAFKNCREQSQGQGREAFHECLQASGIAMPPHPKLNSEQRQAMLSCREQVLGK